MNVSYSRPLEHSWERMKAVLFRKPFPIEAWFVMGLGAWLTDIFSGTRHSYGWRESKTDVGELLGSAGSYLSNGTMFALVMAGLVVLGIVLLVLAWVSARAQFVFLDNVVHGRAAFVEPWRRYGKLGRSQFLWQAAMSFAWLVPIGCIVLPLTSAIAGALAGRGWHVGDVASVIVGVGCALLSTIVIACVLALNEDFVIPLMWKYDEGATAAWARFRPLLFAHLGDFAAYLLFMLLIAILTGIGMVLAGLLTCCVGLVLMVIPYIGTVTTLPVYFVFRALGPMFLRQYGPEWDVWAGMTRTERANTSTEGSPIA